MKRLILLTLLTSSLSFPLELYVAPKFMKWEEYESGQRLLRERGFLLSGGVRFTRGMFKGGVEVYGGTLVYDGQTQAGEPVKTDTEYRGVSLWAGLRRETGGTMRLAGELLYHPELWVRDIKSTEKAIGYSETWFFDTLDVGLELIHSQLGAYVMGKYRLFLRDAYMQASIEGIPQLRPKKGPAYELGIGLRRGSFGTELTYSYVKFRRSQPKPYGSLLVLQPESVRETLSWRILLSF